MGNSRIPNIYIIEQRTLAMSKHIDSNFEVPTRFFFYYLLFLNSLVLSIYSGSLDARLIHGYPGAKAEAGGAKAAVRGHLDHQEFQRRAVPVAHRAVAISAA